MGRRNVLVEGLSGTGKTSVAEELRRRGHHVVHGDRELAYQGDPVTGAPVGGASHEHHLWRVDRVRALAADRSRAVTFFCGGSRNHRAFLDVVDLVVVLEADLATLRRRLERRPEGEWGARPHERDLVEGLHRLGAGTPRADVVVDATAPLARVVDEVLAAAAALDGPPAERPGPPERPQPSSGRTTPWR